MASVRAAVLTILLLPGLCAQRVGVPTEDLTKVGIDELFSVEVTSVDKKSQQLSKAPAAVFVLTADDIRRSGATCIPEALQWVPGLTVLKINGRDWVVSARGSARQYANKILVMIDGQSLYTPLFAGVNWDAIDIPLANIERIEVVRGPGAVMWGPNAVDGLINIITQKARKENGGSAEAAAGDDLRAALTARDDFALGAASAMRVWGNASIRDPSFSAPGYFLFGGLFPFQTAQMGDLEDGSASAGIRIDSQIDARDELLVQANGLRSGRQDPEAAAVVLPDIATAAQTHSDYETGSFQAVWKHTASADADSSLQFTFQKGSYNYSYLNADINNLTVDYQRRQKIGERHELYWGAGFQQYWDNVTGPYRPETAPFRDGSLTLRDEFQISSRWMVSAGIRADYNTYTRWEWQPSFRMLYAPGPRQSFWAGWSRAVRLPSRWDRDFDTYLGAESIAGLTVNSWLIGSHAMRSEVERSWEAGYRYQSGQRWSIDASVFWSNYSQLRALQIAPPSLVFPGGAPIVVADAVENNAGSGVSYGAEIWGRWQVRGGWRIIPSYSYLNESRGLPPDAYSSGPVLPGEYLFDNAQASIRHQALIRSQHDLSRRVQLDLMIRGHSREEGYNLPGTVMGDIRLGWRLTRTSEASLTVQDVTDRRALQAYAEGPVVAIPVRRTVTVRWTQRF